MPYPKFLYHAEHAPEGFLIKSEADEPTGAGWVDTPQKFDPTYVEPAKLVAPESVPADQPNYVPVQYPSWRFNVTTGAERLVQSAEEDAALDPAVWKDSPNPTVKPAVAPAGAKGGLADQKAALYSAKATDVVAQVVAMDSVDGLQIVHGLELANPAGARKTVIAAIEKRMAVLVPVVPGADA